MTNEESKIQVIERINGRYKHARKAILYSLVVCWIKYKNHQTLNELNDYIVFRNMQYEPKIVSNLLQLTFDGLVSDNIQGYTNHAEKYMNYARIHSNNLRRSLFNSEYTNRTIRIVRENTRCATRIVYRNAVNNSQVTFVETRKYHDAFVASRHAIDALKYNHDMAENTSHCAAKTCHSAKYASRLSLITNINNLDAYCAYRSALNTGDDTDIIIRSLVSSYLYLSKEYLII